MKSRVSLARGANEALSEAGPVTEELRGLSTGTALACVLRPAGLALVPRANARGGVSFEIVSARGAKQLWPVGFSAEDKRQKVLPALFEVIEVQIEKGTSLTDAIDAVVKRLEVPLLVDQNAAAAEGVDMKTATAFLPAAKLSYSVILRKLLGQNKLKYELRTDEGGHPFLWVTSYRAH